MTQNKYEQIQRAKCEISIQKYLYSLLEKFKSMNAD